MSERKEDEHPEEELVQDDAIIGVAFRWSIIVAVIAGLGVGAFLLLRSGGDADPVIIDRDPIEAPDPLGVGAASMPSVRFTDVTTGSGIAFVHRDGARGEKLLPETMGGGAAFFDADGDGDEDLLFVSGHVLPGVDPAGAAVGAIDHPTLALYFNDGLGQFEDGSARSGLEDRFYGCGVACGDVDGDGDVDLFVSAVGPDRLFLNTGDGSFTATGSEAGIAGPDDAWSSSAGFFDYDGDGDLDLFVCRYVKWSRAIDLELNFTLNGTDRAYGPPTQYEGMHPSLYRNDGEGRFEDVSVESGIEVANPATGQPIAKSLAATFVDVDRDGFLDIFVANDTVQNFLFRNRGDGTFEEVGAMSGVAFDGMGAATGAMGVDAADYLNDGSLGVAIANFANEASSLYVQQPRDPWQFADMSGAEGIGSPSRLHLSFGLLFLDYDLDGRLDLLQANGHLEDEINEVQPSQHYEQPAQLFWNRGVAGGAAGGGGADGCFAAVPAEGLGDLTRPIVGRGATAADVDGDGDLDVVLTQTGGAPLLLRNEQESGHHWLGVRLAPGPGAPVNRDGIGARVTLTAGGQTQTRVVMPTRSYLSQVPLTVTFGLGDDREVERLRVTWPDGVQQDIHDPAIDRVLLVERAE